MNRPYPDLNLKPETFYQQSLPLSTSTDPDDISINTNIINQNCSVETLPYPSLPYPGFNQSLYSNNHVNVSTDSIGQRVLKRQFNPPQITPSNSSLPKDKTTRPPLNTYLSQESFPNPQYETLAKVRGVDSIRSGQYSVNSNDCDFPENTVNDLNAKLQSVNINDQQQQQQQKETLIPESIARFDQARKLVIEDYSKNQFNSEIQLKWVKTLFEATTNSDLISNYNINGEKLSRTLSESEMKKNEHIFIKQAIKILKKICTDSIDPQAFFILGSLYSNSDPQIKVPRLSVLNKNYEKSFKYYEKASKTNHVVSIYRLAVCYEFGIGTTKNFIESFHLFQKAAELGSVAAMFKLGMIYSKGLLRIPRDPLLSYQWLVEASQRADFENPHALFELGKYFEFDLSKDSEDDIKFQRGLSSVIQPDFNKALTYYKQAAKLNYHPAQFKLGWCYEYGKLNCVIDARRSIGWYSRSAKQGNYQAEMALSGWYLTGAKGILEQNDNEAFLWANKSAESGFVKAEYALGYFYEVGLGCEKNLELSKKFYLKAATNGHEKAVAKLKNWKN